MLALEAGSADSFAFERESRFEIRDSRFEIRDSRFEIREAGRQLRADYLPLQLSWTKTIDAEFRFLATGPDDEN